MPLSVIVLENPLHESLIPGVVAITWVIFFDLFNCFVRQAHASTQLFPLSSQWDTSDYDIIPTVLVLKVIQHKSKDFVLRMRVGSYALTECCVIN